MHSKLISLQSLITTIIFLLNGVKDAPDPGIEELLELGHHLVFIDPFTSFLTYELAVVRSQQSHQNGLLIHYFTVLFQMLGVLL